MNFITMCNCGCGFKAWVEHNSIYFQHKMLGVDKNGPKSELIKFIDNLGFINGKYSVSADCLKIIEQEMEFCE